MVSSVGVVIQSSLLHHHLILTFYGSLLSKQGQLQISFCIITHLHCSLFIVVSFVFPESWQKILFLLSLFLILFFYESKLQATMMNMYMVSLEKSFSRYLLIPFTQTLLQKQVTNIEVVNLCIKYISLRPEDLFSHQVSLYGLF